MNDIVAAKVKQAAGLLREFDLPLWIVQFARETYDNPQPVQELAIGSTVTWPAAFLVTADGESIAIVGTGDVASIEGAGAYDTVIGYVKDVGPPLVEVLRHIDPARIGVSTSRSDDSADNITHGMFEILRDCLSGTPYADRLVSAEDVLVALRSRKLPVEVERIQASIDTTVEMFDFIEQMLNPGITERQVAAEIHAALERQGLTTAWDSAHDPIVNFGPEAAFGHSGPGDTALAPGMLIHVDFGIKRNGYCSDLQRMWYLCRPGESGPPEDVRRAFDTVVESMRSGFRALRPGVAGWEVDAVARAVIVDAGYDEPQFALGHQLGQTTHDGGALLGPRWPRYLTRPEMRLEAGMVFTVEYALPSSAGPIGVEEDVVITDNGALYLTDPQTELTVLPRE